MELQLQQIINPEEHAKLHLGDRQIPSPQIQFTDAQSDEFCGSTIVKLNDTHIQIVVTAELVPVQNYELFEQIVHSFQKEHLYIKPFIKQILSYFSPKENKIIDEQSKQQYYVQYTFKYQIVNEGGNLLAGIILGVNEVLNKSKTLCDLQNPSCGYQLIFSDAVQLDITETGFYNKQTYQFPNIHEKKLMDDIQLVVKARIKGNSYIIMQL